MEKFHGYRIKFWELLGFRFTHSTLYEGFDVKSGQAEFGTKIFHLYISPKFAIAGVYFNETSHNERHAMSSENETIEWFSRVSSEFTLAVYKF